MNKLLVKPNNIYNAKKIKNLLYKIGYDVTLCEAEVLWENFLNHWDWATVDDNNHLVEFMLMLDVIDKGVIEKALGERNIYDVNYSDEDLIKILDCSLIEGDT